MSRWIPGIAAVAAAGLAVGTIGLLPRGGAGPAPAAPAIAPAEHATTLAALRPPKRERPVIAILTLNAATEVTDFLSAYGVLARADVADVAVLAEHTAPVRLVPLSYGAPITLYSATLWIEPQATMRAFDERNPDGADYVVVPAIEPRDNRVVTDWIVAQRLKGAKIVSVCNGSLTLAAAGLLDGRRATAHWSGVPRLREAHPTMQWIRDRRYVVDDGVMTTTGITATIPAMVALAEAIAGRDRAEQLAAELGLDHWDERHDSSALQLRTEHRKTFVRNLLVFWRHETVAVPVSEGVDEIALGLTVDAWARTGLAEVATLTSGGGGVRSRHGLTIRPEAAAGSVHVDRTLPPPGPVAPARTVDRELANIAARYDRPTAELVALILEYPWATQGTTSAGRSDT